MMELFLYACEVCGAASFSGQYHGRTWYAPCPGCARGTYHDGVLIDLTCGQFVKEETMYASSDYAGSDEKSREEPTNESRPVDQ